MRWILRLIATLVVLTVTQAMAGFALMRDEAPGPVSLPLLLASSLLTAGVALGLGSRLAARGGGRSGLLFAVMFGIPANYLAETLFFDIGLRLPSLTRLYAYQAVLNVVLCAFVGWLVRHETPPAPARRVSPRVVPLAVTAVAYVVIYFVAGLTAFPFLADFYAGRAMPAPPAIALVQLGRGLGFAGVAFVIAHWFSGSRTAVMLATGLTLSIVGGVAPLIVPNAFLPDGVRLVHLVEVGLSNFAFGVLAAWLLTREGPRP